VVGVLAADLSLNLPDYKAAERTYQLLTQVSGRAGRGKKEGRVVIQTYSPDHYSVGCSVKNEYNEFYNKEISIREDMNYPPFTRLLCINFSSKNENFLVKNVQDIGIKLKEYMKNMNNMAILGPCPCPISKIKEMFRWQIIIKGAFSQEVALAIRNFITEETKDIYNELRVSMDINPNSLL
jgi:primosomal protein N' (replication factor Y)